MSGMSGIEINKGRDIFPSAVFIDCISIMCRVQKEFLNTEFRKECFHGKKGVQKGKHVVPGSPFQKREYGKIAVRIGCHIHVEMVAEEIAFPMDPIPSCSPAGNSGICSGRKESRSPYNRKFVFSAAVQRCVQESHHQQEPDALDRSDLC